MLSPNRVPFILTPVLGPQDDNRPRLLIIGAGVAGCSLAYELTRRGARVTLTEAGEVGREGASAVPVALLNPHRGRTARASNLDRAGLEATRDLARALARMGLKPGVHLPGVLRIAGNDKQAAKWRKLAGARLLAPADVPPPYRAPFGGLLVERGGWLEPRRFLAALVTAAGRRGLELLENCPVDAVERVSGQFVARTSRGDVTADRVVFCTGAGQGLGLAPSGLERLAGDVAELATDVSLPYPVAGAVYGAQREDSFFVGGNHRPADQSDPGAAEALGRSASRLIPGLEGAELRSIWTGVRAKQAGNQPLIRELEPGLWFYGALAGRGFLCSAYLSRQLARQLF